MPEISVTVPVYNVERYLRRCLDSVINQTFRLEYEIICVDDGSTDNSGKILDEYAQKYPKIKVIHQENRGLSAARNTAMKYVTGKYTMFVDSDDFIAANALEGLYRYAQIHNSDVVIFDFLRSTPDMKNVSKQHFENIARRYGNRSFNVSVAEPFVYRFVSVATWSKFYLTDLIKDIEFIDGLNNQDVVHWASVYTKAKRVNYLPVPYYFYVMQRVDANTSDKGRKVYDAFRAFAMAKDVLTDAGYFDRFRSIHYAHLTCNLVVILQKIKPELRKELVDKIKDYEIDIDYEKFDKEDFFPFEKKNMKIIKFVKENNYADISKLLQEQKIWT